MNHQKLIQLANDPAAIEWHSTGTAEPFATNQNFWDCECTHEYIHPKQEESCAACGTFSDEQPDSRQYELHMLFPAEITDFKFRQ